MIPIQHRLFNTLREFRRLLRQIRKQGIRVALLAGVDKLVRLFGNRPAGRYNRITPQIILGGQPAGRHLVRLAQVGVTGVINMRDEYSYADEVGQSNLNYLELPTVDNTAPTLDDLRAGIAFIEHEIERGGSVYIHCWEGLGRGPSMAAAYFISQGDTPEEAWARIRQARPFIRPTDEQLDALVLFADAYDQAAAPYAEPASVTADG